MFTRILFHSLKVISILSVSVISAHASSGFYIGFALGSNHHAGSHNLSVESTQAANTSTRNFNGSLSGGNLHGDIFLGYAQKIQDIHTALEAYIGLSRLETKSLLDITGFNSTNELNVRSNNGYGISAHLGYPVNVSTKAYVKVGAEVRRFSTNVAGNDDIVNHNKSYYSTGFVPGLGLEAEVTPSISVRSEYRVALHPAKQFKTSKNNLTTNYKVTPRIHHFNVGVYFKI